jgi:hypothetical protein
MDSRKDIKIEADFVNANNDIEYYESDADHIQDTIESNQGAYKENPLDGVGVDNYLNSSGQEQILSREIIVQLKSDLYTVDKPIIQFESDGSLTINPNATL